MDTVKHMVQYLKEHQAEHDDAIELCETVRPECLALIAYEALHHLLALSVFQNTETRGRYELYHLDEEDCEIILEKKLKLLFTGYDLLSAVPVALQKIREEV